MKQEQAVCTVIGFKKTERHSNGWTVQRCGTVYDADGIYLSFSAPYDGCIGGAYTIAGCIQQIRARWHYPSVRHCKWDGRIDRR